MACPETLEASGAGTSAADGMYPKTTDANVGEGNLRWDQDGGDHYILDTGSNFQFRGPDPGGAPWEETLYETPPHGGTDCPHEMSWGVLVGDSPAPTVTEGGNGEDSHEGGGALEGIGTLTGGGVAGPRDVAGLDYAEATVTNPDSDLSGIALLIDLTKMPASWWDAATSSDGERLTVTDGNGQELARDVIAFDDEGKAGLVRALWPGTLTSGGEQKVRVYPPHSKFAAYGSDDEFGRHNAYASDSVLYLPFEDGSGEAEDRTDNDNAASLTGNAAYTGTGKAGGGIEITGEGDTAEIPGLLGQPAAITVAAWARIDGVASNGSDLISLGDNVMIRLSDSVGGTASGIYYDGSSWRETEVGGIGAVTDGEWHHWLFVCDPQSGDQRLYRDGVLIASEATGGSLNYTDNGPDTVIGAHISEASRFVEGDIDEVRAWSGALSSAAVSYEVGQLHNQDSHWNLDGGVWGWSGAGGGGAVRGTGELSGGGEGAPSFIGFPMLNPPREIAPGVWRWTWEDLGGPYHIYHRGRRVSVTQQAWIDVVEHDRTIVPAIEVARSASEEALQTRHPERMVLQWRQPEHGPQVMYYSIELPDGTVEDIVHPSPRRYHTWTSGRLGDGVVHERRVVPVLAGGHRVDPAVFKVLIVRMPDPPRTSVSYDAQTGQVIVSE